MIRMLIAFTLTIPAAFAHDQLPHFDLEITTQGYRHLLRARNKSSHSDPAIERAIALGERLSEWINLVNEGRRPQDAIRLTSPETRTGIPIDKPHVYNPALIQKKTQDILAEMPEEMRSVLLSSGELPETIHLEDKLFIKHGRELNKNYQLAARYKMLLPYRFTYISRAMKDVRGYHYLTTNQVGPHELRDVYLIPEEQKTKISDALIKLCMNATNTAKGCERKVAGAFKKNRLVKLYERWYPLAKKNWDSFFEIPAGVARKDVQWGSTTIVPFNTPSVAKFIPYLKDNIEDEFRFRDWSLKLYFGTFDHGPLLIFKPGVTPHVNGLGGNQIVMDANQPIEEYESQWTIRHEFGHVLGLPDCYHEFYDTKLDAFVSYQLDTTDLMCSRAGDMNERIYKELEKAYKL